MKNDKILERLDSMMTRIGSSAINVHTTGSDYDFAISLSVWNKIYPILSHKLGFKIMGSCNSSGRSKYGDQLLFNTDNVKMTYDEYTYDFIIYDDDKISQVNTAMNKFKLFLEQCPSVMTYMIYKQMRIEIFQHFLQLEFNDKVSKSDDELLDDIFAGM